MSIGEDAREFGRHFKQGGWRLGLLVARNCEPGKPGRPKADAENPSREMDSGKVSFTDFAGEAGVSQSHVSYYYKAWKLAADDGKCQHAQSLSPEDEDLDDLEEDDEHTRELWSKYLEKAKVPEKPRRSGNPKGANASQSRDGASSVKATQAVESLVKTSEQLSKRLVQVISATPLSGEDEELAQFAADLRQTRFVLDGYCREIDLLLARIGFGDAEPAANTDPDIRNPKLVPADDPSN